MSMFCYQCEQTAGGKGCMKVGVCGKQSDTAALQDLQIHMLKIIAYDVDKHPELRNEELDRFIIEGLFSTLTNVDFDNKRFIEWIHKADEYNQMIISKIDTNSLSDEFKIRANGELEELLELAKRYTLAPKVDENLDVKSLQDLLLFGMKGMAAYSDHALVIGLRDDEVTGFFYKGLAALLNDKLGINELYDLNMELGQVNLRCMELLDKANTEAYGNPVPSLVNLGMKKGPFIVISGHDLHDLKQLLEQTEGKGINIYTHGEMLAAHGYPELKKYKHLAGNFGTAWQNQQKEMDGIPGAILFTTNCIQKPKDSYKDRLFTTGLVGWEGVAHINSENGKKDFTPVIEKALELGGYSEDKNGKDILVGFAHNAVLGAADKVIELVKSGKIKQFFLIGGCDGAKPGRNYYTEFAEKAPKDSVILTLACGKYRFNTLDFGDIEGIPRLLDCGQCNDAYSAIKIAVALADAFKCGVNDLPLKLILSWYEQKAVCILLTLLSLGIKDIRLGPSLPAFITPNILQVLMDKFDIKPISSVENDLETILDK